MRIAKALLLWGALLIALALAAGCGMGTALDSAEWPTRKPASKNIAGSWVLAPESVKLARAKGGYGDFSTTIVLSEDGKLEIKGLPDCVPAGGFREAGKTFADYKGTWELEEPQGYWGVAARTATGSDSAGRTFHLGLWNTQAPYRMWFAVGDIDEGNYLFFDRKGDVGSALPATGETDPPTEDDFAPGLGFFALLMLVVMIILAIVAVVAVVFLIAAAIAALFGVSLSAVLFARWRKKKRDREEN